MQGKPVHQAGMKSVACYLQGAAGAGGRSPSRVSRRMHPPKAPFHNAGRDPGGLLPAGEGRWTGSLPRKCCLPGDAQGSWQPSPTPWLEGAEPEHGAGHPGAGGQARAAWRKNEISGLGEARLPLP